MSDIIRFEDEQQFLQYFVGTVGPLHLARLVRLINGGENLSRKTGPVYDFWKTVGELDWPGIVDQTFLRTFLTDTVLTKTDRAGMAFGLEGRVPFLDDEMVEFAARLPARWKDRGGQSKYLLRKLLKSKLPGNIWKRKKQGFSIPIAEWLRGPLQPVVEQYLNEKALGAGGHFDPREVRAVVDEHLSGRANHSHLIWSLLSFELWRERYL
jgi:asparagine synthase (glutamine-hydrolysing)